jgi:hypothetical protein
MTNYPNPQRDYETYRSEQSLTKEANYQKGEKMNMKNPNVADDYQTAIDKPSHYQDILIKGKNGQMAFEAIEIIDSILEHLKLPPAVSHSVGNALKYLIRLGHKASDNASTKSDLQKTAQDLGKAGWYCNNGKKLMEGMV